MNQERNRLITLPLEVRKYITSFLSNQTPWNGDGYAWDFVVVDIGQQFRYWNQHDRRTYPGTQDWRENENIVIRECCGLMTFGELFVESKVYWFLREQGDWKYTKFAFKQHQIIWTELRRELQQTRHGRYWERSQLLRFSYPTDSEMHPNWINMSHFLFELAPSFPNTEIRVPIFFHHGPRLYVQAYNCNNNGSVASKWMYDGEQQDFACFKITVKLQACLQRAAMKRQVLQQARALALGENPTEEVLNQYLQQIKNEVSFIRYNSNNDKYYDVRVLNY